MTGPGDYPDEMERNRKFSDDQAEALIAGRTPAGDADLDQVAAFFKDAREVTRTAPDAATEQRHLAAIVEAAHLTPAAGAAAPTAPRSRSKTMLGAILASFWTKAIAAAAAAVLATGGLAAAHALPAPAQDAVASVAHKVGINLPSSDDATASHEANESPEPSGSPHASGDHGKSVSDDVHQVQSDPTLQGRDRGKAISDVANQNRQNDKHESPEPSDNPGHSGDDHGNSGDHPSASSNPGHSGDNPSGGNPSGDHGNSGSGGSDGGGDHGDSGSPHGDSGSSSGGHNSGGGPGN